MIRPLRRQRIQDESEGFTGKSIPDLYQTRDIISDLELTECQTRKVRQDEIDKQTQCRIREEEWCWP